MNRRVTYVAGGVVVLVAAAVLLAGAERRARLARQVPAWLNFRQPPESAAVEMMTLSPAESWAANRCVPMVGPSKGYSAGSRIRRTYPGTLADSDDSIVRGSFSLEGGV